MTNQPDSQAEDELDKIFYKAINAKEIAINTAAEDTTLFDNSDIAKEANRLLDILRAEFKANVTGYAERLATERAIEELSKVEPAAYVDEGYTMVKDRIKELKATLTKETKQ